MTDHSDCGGPVGSNGLCLNLDIARPEPTAIDMVTELHRAVYGDTWARPESPQQVWALLLGKVRGLASGWCGECERRAIREGSATPTMEEPECEKCGDDATVPCDCIDLHPPCDATNLLLNDNTMAHCGLVRGHPGSCIETERLRSKFGRRHTSEMLRPVVLDGQQIEFTDGSKVSVWTVAKEWAVLQERLHGDQCMASECPGTATINVHLWGHHVGRVCEQHDWDIAAGVWDART